MSASCSAIPKRGRKRKGNVSEEERIAIARNGSPVHGHWLVIDKRKRSISGGLSNNCRRQKTTPPIGWYRLEWTWWTNMVSVFRVVWSGCPVSRSPLRRKDEQRIRRVAGEQLQRLEASKRTSMQSGRVHTDMVHLGLVEGKSRVESCVDLWSDEHRDFLTSRYINTDINFDINTKAVFFSARWHAVPACKPDWFVVFSKVSAARIAKMLRNRATNRNAAWSRAKRMILRRWSNRRKVSLMVYVLVSNDVVNEWINFSQFQKRMKHRRNALTSIQIARWSWRMVIAGSNITSIRAVDAASNRSTAEDESPFQAGSPFPWSWPFSIRLNSLLSSFS